VRRLPTGPVAPPVIPGGLNRLAVIVLLLTLWHASHGLGVRRTLAFLAITAVTSWLFEELGVSTGLIYGPYHYTSTLGPLLGLVPVLIPLAWFVLVYPSYLMANVIMDRLPFCLPGGLGDLIGLALSGALVMTASDLIVDPILSGPGFRAWVWDTAGRYYGVPIQNYLGWIATAFIIHLLCRSIERRTMLQRSELRSMPHGEGLLATRPSDVAGRVDLRMGSASRARRDS
jgi:uncharacterized membrane protein